MLGEVLNPSILLFALAAGGIGFVIALVVGRAAGEGPRAAYRAGEAALLTIAGGVLASSFVALFVALGGGDPGDGLLAGWLFFLWPGALDTIAAIFGERVLTRTEILPWIAAVVGSVAGFFDGLWRIHRWAGPGVLTFLADVTWGLAGTTQGVLIHLIHLGRSAHPSEPRGGVHRYETGFRFRSGFAVTLGSVMSNMGSNGPGSALYEHERVHVLQNRIFGPLFTLTYLGWMVLMFVPALLAGYASGNGPAVGVERLCYFNNPWEAWAYRVGQGCGGRPRAARGALIWSDRRVALASLPFGAVVIAAVTLVLALTWF